jgi:arginase
MNSFNTRKAQIFGVPIDLGSERLGVEMGPMAIRHAGLHQAPRYNSIEFTDYGDTQIDRTPANGNVVDQICRLANRLADMVYNAAHDGYTPIVLGDDHSASIGSIGGDSKYCDRRGLIWIDGHTDANTPETRFTGNVHGMTVAISPGYGYPELINCSGLSPKVYPEDICIIGSKNVDPGDGISQ